MENYNKDNYPDNEIYQYQKLTIDEIRQFQQFNELSDKEIEELSDLIFELAQVATKVIQ